MCDCNEVHTNLNSASTESSLPKHIFWHYSTEVQQLDSKHIEKESRANSCLSYVQQCLFHCKGGVFTTPLAGHTAGSFSRHATSSTHILKSGSRGKIKVTILRLSVFKHFFFLKALRTAQVPPARLCFTLTTTL